MEPREDVAHWLQKNTAFACNLEWDELDTDAQENFRSQADQITPMIRQEVGNKLASVVSSATDEYDLVRKVFVFYSALQRGRLE